MERFYYAEVDDLGVLCVGPVEDAQPTSAEEVAGLATFYPDTIYFAVQA